MGVTLLAVSQVKQPQAACSHGVWHGVVHCADGIHRGVTAPSQRLANDLRAELRGWLQGPRRQPAHRVVMGGQHPGNSNELRQHSV